MIVEMSPAPETDLETLHQYGSFLSGAERWNLHEKYAVPRIGIMDASRPDETNFGIEGEMMMLLNLKGDEHIADIACGDGRFLLRCMQMGHQGKLTGINYPEGPFLGNAINLEGNSQIEFIESDASDLRLPDGSPIPDNSFDLIISNFAHYHMSRRRRALKEARRVLKPGGRMGLATRDVGHQDRLWKSAKGVARDMQRKLQNNEFTVDDLLNLSEKELQEGGVHLLGSDQSAQIIAPEPFYRRFDLEKAHREASKIFTYDNISFRQYSESHLDADAWEDYYAAALYLYSNYKVRVNQRNYLIRSRGPDFGNSINNIIKPKFDKEVRKYGFFVEYIMQGFDIWKKEAA